MKAPLRRVGQMLRHPLVVYGLTFAVFVLLWAALPQISSAEPCGTQQNPCPTPGEPIKLDNPLDVENIVDFLKKLIDVAIMLGIPVAVLFIIYAGFLFVTAQGNPTKLAAARKALLAAIIGTAILLGAWVIATAIKGTIDEISA